jgi:hypothetical protein
MATEKQLEALVRQIEKYTDHTDASQPLNFGAYLNGRPISIQIGLLGDGLVDNLNRECDGYDQVDVVLASAGQLDKPWRQPKS